MESQTLSMHYSPEFYPSSSILRFPTQTYLHEVNIFTTKPLAVVRRKCQNLRKKTKTMFPGQSHQRKLVVAAPWTSIWTQKLHGLWITWPLAPTPCHLFCSPLPLTNLTLPFGLSLMEKTPSFQLLPSLIATRSSLVCFQFGFLLTSVLEFSFFFWTW